MLLGFTLAPLLLCAPAAGGRGAQEQRCEGEAKQHCCLLLLLPLPHLLLACGLLPSPRACRPSRQACRQQLGAGGRG